MGWCMEILWTGLHSLFRKDFRLTANTSIWMFPIYGLAVFLEPVCDIMMPLPIVLRGAAYVVFIFAAEYAVGTALKRLRVCPWDYSGSRFHVKGIIRLDYAPVWFAAGLIIEFIHRRI